MSQPTEEENAEMLAHCRAAPKTNWEERITELEMQNARLRANTFALREDRDRARLRQGDMHRRAQRAESERVRVCAMYRRVYEQLLDAWRSSPSATAGWSSLWAVFAVGAFLGVALGRVLP